jgi:ABC transport system ATP-binding/permease protein
MQAANANVTSIEPAKVSAKPATVAAPANKGRKLSTNEARELAELPSRIDALDRETADIQVALGDPKNYLDAAGAKKIESLQARLRAIEIESANAMKRWEQLEALRDAALH